jgi:putative transposase
MVDYLAREVIPISGDRVRNLMRHMGLRAIYQKLCSTVHGDPSERFSYLVDVSMVTAVDHVWATDIAYIPPQNASIIWWRSWISSLGPSSAGRSPQL